MDITFAVCLIEDIERFNYIYSCSLNNKRLHIGFDEEQQYIYPGCLVIVEYDSHPISCLRYHIHTSENHTKYCYLDTLAVMPEYKDGGIEEEVLRFVDRVALEYDCQYILTEIAILDTSTIEFLKAHRYEVDYMVARLLDNGSVMNVQLLYKTIEDAVGR